MRRRHATGGRLLGAGLRATSNKTFAEVAEERVVAADVVRTFLDDAVKKTIGAAIDVSSDIVVDGLVRLLVDVERVRGEVGHTGGGALISASGLSAFWEAERKMTEHEVREETEKTYMEGSRGFGGATVLVGAGQGVEERDSLEKKKRVRDDRGRRNDETDDEDMVSGCKKTEDFFRLSLRTG